MTPLSTDERRALALLAALLLLASAARWLERPRNILDDAPDVDVAALEEASRTAKDARTTPTRQSARAAETTNAAGRTESEYTTATKIDPNYASPEELDRLPGIGPAVAARIVAERQRAPFSSVDDMRRVRGLGATLRARIAEHVTLPQHAPGPQRTQRAPDPHATTSHTVPDTNDTAPLDLNTATAQQLQRISGIGPAIARRLVARRDSLGRFRGFHDVDSIPGVGPALLARIQAAAVIRDP